MGMYSRNGKSIQELDNWWLKRGKISGSGRTVSGPSIDSLEKRVQAYEKRLITEALEDNNGNQTKAARMLRTTKRIIQYKIKKYNIDYMRYKTSETGVE